MLRIVAMNAEIVSKIRKTLRGIMKGREKIELHVESNTTTNKHGCHSLVQTYKNATISSKK
jgi:hypothetical protein